MTKEQAIAGLQAAGVMPLYYHPHPDTCLQILETLYGAGIRSVEFTNRGDQALKNFSALVKAKEKMPGLVLGVGTIHHAEQAAAFLGAGADFLVSPFFDAAVADHAYLQKKPWIPGCMTPTEIHHAQVQGCEWIKLFPGEVLGPSFVKGVQPLFPGVNFMVTGGVVPEQHNMFQWFQAGAKVLGLGSKLVQNADLEEPGGWDRLGQKAQAVVSIVQAYKQASNG